MKVLVASCVFFASLLTTTSSYARGIYYEITIQNVTKGQPLTPAVVAVHSPELEILEIGKKASEGIQTLAKDGDTSVYTQELSSNYRVKRFKVGAGLILPGMQETIKVEANDPSYRFTILSMLARTNDGIMVLKNVQTDFMQIGQSKTYLAEVYDAGAETNTELCSDIPAPPCNNPGSGPEAGEGFVHPHPGIQNIGDLDALRDAFGSAVAKIIIKRVR